MELNLASDEKDKEKILQIHKQQKERKRLENRKS